MKRKFLCLLLATVLLLSVGLTACQSAPEEGSDSETGATESVGGGGNDGNGGGKKNPYVLEDGVPYQLTYTSNNDGTCSVTGIIVNFNYCEAFDLVIPEQSPDGDTVTRIAWGQVFDSVSALVPTYATEGFDLPLKTAYPKWDQKYTEDEFMYKKFVSMYAFIDLNAPDRSDEEKEDMKASYPLCSYMPIYHLPADWKFGQIAWLAGMYQAHMPDVAYSEQKKIVGLSRAEGLSDEEIAEVYPDFDRVSEYAHVTTFVRSISLPDTLTAIDADCFVNLWAEEAIVVPDGYTDDMVAELRKSDCGIAGEEE